jgi:hypothetical protein
MGDHHARLDEPSTFVREYFMQTRREIDTVKRQRDLILNFAILVIGAVSFAVIKSQEARDFVKTQWEGAAVGVPALIFITSLFWLRYRKLQQIKDRWRVLHSIAESKLGPLFVRIMLESKVVPHLDKWTYHIWRDFVPCIMFCVPIYGQLLINFWHCTSYPEGLRTAMLSGVVPFHCLICWSLFGRHAK